MAEAYEHTNQAMGAVEASRERHRTRNRGLRVYALALMGVFFVVLMIGLVAGVVMYRSIASSQARASELDMQAGIVASAVHAGDVHDALGVGQGPEGDALVLVDSISGSTYETRIYQYQGHLVQEYALAGHDYRPQDANELLEAEDFGFQIDGGLVTFEIDGRSFDLYVRSAQDGTREEPATSASDGAAAVSIEDEPALGGGRRVAS